MTGRQEIFAKESGIGTPRDRAPRICDSVRATGIA
jgi:hypothetical protein